MPKQLVILTPLPPRAPGEENYTRQTVAVYTGENEFLFQLETTPEDWQAMVMEGKKVPAWITPPQRKTWWECIRNYFDLNKPL